MDFKEKELKKVTGDILSLMADRNKALIMMQNPDKNKADVYKWLIKIKRICIDNANAYKQAINLNGIMTPGQNTELVKEQKRAYEEYKEATEYFNDLIQRIEKDVDVEEKPQLEENPHPQIFSGKGWPIWQRMFEELDMTESSRTDVRFVLEAMKRDSLIHKTIGEGNFREWLNDTYGFAMDKMPFVNIKQSSNKTRLSLYSSIRDSY